MLDRISRRSRGASAFRRVDLGSRGAGKRPAHATASKCSARGGAAEDGLRGPARPDPHARRLRVILPAHRQARPPIPPGPGATLSRAAEARIPADRDHQDFEQTLALVQLPGQAEVVVSGSRRKPRNSAPTACCSSKSPMRADETAAAGLGSSYEGARGTIDVGVSASALLMKRYGHAIAIYLPADRGPPRALSARRAAPGNRARRRRSIREIAPPWAAPSIFAGTRSNTPTA